MGFRDHDDQWALFEDAIYDIAEKVDLDLAATIENDDYAQELYFDAFFGGPGIASNPDAYDQFESYMQETYGIEWDDYFDWNDYRELYDTAA